MTRKTKTPIYIYREVHPTLQDTYVFRKKEQNQTQYILLNQIIEPAMIHGIAQIMFKYFCVF